LESFETNQIICEDSNNIDQIIPQNNVSLSLVVPPYVHLKNYYSDIQELKKQDAEEWEEKTETGKHLAFIEKLLEKIAKVTKSGGYCCLIVSNDLNPESDVMIPIGNRICVKIMDSKDVLKDWDIEGEFIWVKASKESVDTIEPFESGTIISADKTPFSTIYILRRKGEGIESQGILDKLDSIHISEEKKTEISESVWYVPFEKLDGFQDHLPQEILLRLIMVYSDEGDLILDPFSNYGITAIASKIIKRNYFCIDKNPQKIKEAKNRINKFFDL
jgi:site-specific DNA-methyltransferase (adenine-specific)